MKQETYSINQVPLTAPSLSILKERKYILPETPCDHCFQDRRQCEKYALACKDFAMYIDKGKVRNKYRYPTREMFLKINPDFRTKELPEMSEAIVKEQKDEKTLLNDIRVGALSAIDDFLSGSADIEKARIACLVYGLVLKADTIAMQQKQIKGK